MVDLISIENASSVDDNTQLATDELLSIENWRNKAKKSNPVQTLVLSNSPEISAPKKRTKYFEPFPEIKQIEITNEKGKKVKLFLENGNLCKERIQIDKKSIIVKNTCPFESIMSIIAFAATDSPSYLEYLKRLSNRNRDMVNYIL